jgi:hypothetical protein
MAKQVILRGTDLISNKHLFKERMSTNLVDMSPWQMIPEEDKNEDWIEWNADWFEQVGYNQILKQERSIIKNRRLVSGLIDAEDYILAPEYNEYSGLLAQIPQSDTYSVLQQYFPVIPNVISTLVGEHLQRDNKVVVRGVDDFTLSERLEFKENLFSQILLQRAMQEKQIALAQMGVFEDSENPEAQKMYQEEMSLVQQAAEVESQFKKFVTTAEIWGQHVIDSAYAKYSMDTLEKENFKESLTNSREYWHLDMKEDGFTVEILDSAYCFGHKALFKTYSSEGDYFGWFTWMSIGDIIDKYGENLDDEQLETLRSQMTSMSGLNLTPNSLKTMPGAYYDYSKPYPEALQNPDLQEALVRKELEARFSNLNHDNTAVPAAKLFNMGNNEVDKPHMFRVMRLYWKSQRKVSYLTKVGRDGSVEFQGWVDETFKATVPPVYDNSLIKAKTTKNLIYGEHLDTTYTNEWRHLIKIGPNSNHQFWRTAPAFKPIYLDGQPCKFQFKGKDDIYDAMPPVEGVEYKTVGLKPVSLADRMKPWQIAANICGNKTIEIMAKDIGILGYINRATVPRNTSNEEMDAWEDPIQNNIENAKASGILDYTTSKEQAESYGGQVVPPGVINLSRIAEATQYFQLFNEFKLAAMESVGITRERSAQARASQTATSIQQGVQFSEAQTLELFTQHDKLMERVYQRILEATQYYASKNPTSKVSYLNTKHENAFIEVAGGELHRHFNIYAQSSPRMKQLEKDFRQLLLTDNTLGANTLEKAEGLFASSSVELLEKMKEINYRITSQEQQKHQEELEAKYAQIDAQKEIERMRIENDNIQKDLDRQSKERVAMINAMKGMQTDVNANATPDSIDTLNYYLQSQDQISKTQIAQQDLDLKKQQHLDNNVLAQQKMQSEIEREKIKAASAEKVAKMNKNKYDK